MLRQSSERLGAVAGIVFALLFLFAVLTLGDLPARDHSDEEVLSYYADSDKRTTAIVSIYLLALAGVVFLWFLGSLRSVLRRAEGEPGTLSNIGFASGVLFVAMLFAASAALGAVPAGMELGDVAQPDADVSRLLPQLGFGLLLLFGMFAAISLMVATSVLALRLAVLPRWLAWLGFVCAVVLLFGVIFIPIVALPIWVIAVSIVLFRRARP